MTIDVAQLLVRVRADTAQAEAQIGGLSGMLSSRGALLLGIGGAGLAMVAIGGIAAHMAGDFQSGITTLVTGAGEARSNMGLVSQGILDLATSTGESTQQLISGMFMIESAGFHGKAGLDILRVAAEGAKVGNADLGTVADATTTILKDFGSTGITATQAVNTLVATVANGKTHMEDLAQALSSILPTAAAAGVGLNDVMGAMATMTGEGVPAADAATHLRQMIIALEAPSSTAQKALKAVGLSAADVADEMKNKGLPATIAMITDAIGKKFPAGSAGYVAAIKDISGGMREMQGMLQLSGSHLKDFNANVKTITGSVKTGGETVRGWADVQATFNQKFDKAKEVVETLMIQLGTKLLPVLGDLADAFAKNLPAAITSVSNAIAGVQKFFADTGPQATALKMALVLLGGAFAGLATYGIATAIPAIIASVTAFGAQAVAAGAAAIATLAAAAPFIVIGVAIAAVAIGIYELITHWKQVSAFLEGVWKAVVAGVIAGFTWIGNEAHALWSNIVGAFNAGVGWVKGLIGGIVNWLVSTWQAQHQWEVNLFKAIWAGIQAAVQGGITLVKNIIFGEIQAIVGIFSWLYNHNYYFKDLVDGIVREFRFLVNVVHIIWQDITTFLTNAWQRLVGLATTVYHAVTNEISREFNNARALITTVWTDITGWVTGMWTKLVNEAKSRFSAIYVGIEARINQVKARLEAVWTTIHDNIVAVGTRIYTAVTDAWNKVTTFISNLFTPVGHAVKSGVVDPITGAITGLVTTAESWGANLLKMFISGITGQIGALKNTVSNVVSNVASFLGFHSPAKEGPGAEADTWAPNLMSMYADGLRAARPKLALAAAHALGGVSDALRGDVSGLSHLHLGNVRHGSEGAAIRHLALSPAAQALQAMAASNPAGGGAPSQVTLVLDGKAMARAIWPYLGREARLATGVRS